MEDSFNVARLTLGVMDACLEVGDYKEICCDPFQAPERRKRAGPSE